MRLGHFYTVEGSAGNISTHRCYLGTALPTPSLDHLTALLLAGALAVPPTQPSLLDAVVDFHQ